MANKCDCGKRIARGATHCANCAWGAGGYRSNMAAELADADRKRAAAESRAAAAKARKSAAAQAKQRKIAERQAAAKAAQQKRKVDEAKRVAALKTARKLSNARNRPEPEQPKKKGWW